MQARKLKQILDTNYIIQLCSEDDICIGSSYIHDIIKFDRITLKTKNADVRNFKELERIYDKCKELINSGEMREIADNNDSTEGMFKIYIWSDWEGLIESWTDKIEYPAVDYTGRFLYENTTFKERKKAVDYGIKSLSQSMNDYSERIAEYNKDIQNLSARLKNKAELLNSLIRERLGKW